MSLQTIQCPALKQSQPILESNPNEVLPALKDRRAGGDKVLVESQQIWVKVNDLAENNPTKSVF